MTKRSAYYYSLLKYVHDVSTGEFVNVGVVAYSPSEKKILYKFRRNLGRVGDIFPELRASRFKSLVGAVRTRFCEKYPTNQIDSDISFPDSLQKALSSILKDDDSALQWHSMSSGVTADLQASVDHIYERYSGKYDKHRAAGRSDDDIVRSFKKELESRRILSYFEKKTISGKNDDVNFEFAWKNGVWHCIEPVSFDLAAADSIKEKARRCAGEMVGISDAASDFKVYWLVAKPSDQTLNEAYERAIGILNNVQGVNLEIYREDQESALIQQLAEKIEAHEASPLDN